MSTGVWIWSVQAVVSGMSLAIGRPWTGLLSRGRYDGPIRSHPLFRETNMVITAGWTTYFAVAAITTVLTSSWTAIAFVVPTPLLGLVSYRAGDGYSAWRMRGALTEGTVAMTTPSQSMLREMITDKGDDEILDLLRESPGGIEGVLDATVAGMAEALDPDNAQDCVVGYEIDSGGEHFAYRVEVRGHDVEAERCSPSDARVVLQLNVPEYLRLITGLLDGTEAFMSGRMRIRGDVMFAPQIGRMFGTA